MIFSGLVHIERGVAMIPGACRVPASTQFPILVRFFLFLVRRRE